MILGVIATAIALAFAFVAMASVRASAQNRRAWQQKLDWLADVHLPMLRQHPLLIGPHFLDVQTERQAWRARKDLRERGLRFDCRDLTKGEMSALIGLFCRPNKRSVEEAELYGIEADSTLFETDLVHLVCEAKLERKRHVAASDCTDDSDRHCPGISFVARISGVSTSKSLDTVLS